MNKRAIAIGAAAIGVLWAGTSAYFWRAYQPKKATPAIGKRRVACIGDSITFGAGVLLQRERQAWPALLERMLGRDYQVMNFGVSGATAQPEGDTPYPADFFQAAKDARPDTYILMLGTNDSKPYNWDAERYEAAMRKLIEELRAEDYPHGLLLLLPPKAFPGKNGKIGYDISDDVIREQVHPIATRLADEYGLPVVDLYLLTQGHPEYFADGVHPNALGNKVIAQRIYQELK